MRFVGLFLGLWISMVIAATSSLAADDIGGSAFRPKDYQQKFIGDDSRFLFALRARQVGKSTEVALKTTDKALRWEAAGRRYLCLLASAGERQSRELFEKTKLFIEAAQAGGVELGERYLDDAKLTALTLTFPGGSRIVAVPSNPRTVRGFTGDVVLDEFAFHEDQDAIFTAVLPTITRSRDFQLAITTTPNGCLNRAYQIWSGSDNNTSDVWSRHKTTIHDAVEAGLDIDIETLRAGIADETIWQQEYLCEFVDEATAWLTWDMIRACESPDVQVDGWKKPAIAQAIGAHVNASWAKGPQFEGALYLGWDLARWHDLSVMWLFEQLGDVLWTRAVVAFRGASFSEQEAMFNRLMNLGVKRACIDQTGMGEKVVEDAQYSWGAYRAEGVKFSAPVKAELASEIRQRFEDRTIRIPIDNDVREDLHCVRRMTTAAGNVRFEGTAGGSHADRFWAAALAVHAAHNPVQPGIVVL